MKTRSGSAGWRREVRAPAEILVTAALLAADGHFVLAFSHGGGGEESLWNLFLKGHSSHPRGVHPLSLIASQRPHLLTPSHWGLRLHHVHLGRTQTFSPPERPLPSSVVFSVWFNSSQPHGPLAIRSALCGTKL